MPSQPSQLWSRRMGSRAEAAHDPPGSATFAPTTSSARLNAPTLSISSSATASELAAGPGPPSLSPICTTLPRSLTIGELRTLTPLTTSTRSSWSHSFLSDIWSPRESDNLVSPATTATPIYPERHHSVQDLRSTFHSLPPTVPRSAGLPSTAKRPTSVMDTQNMSVAVQVALQIIGVDGGYDSDDEQYCRQALRWLQDPTSLQGEQDLLHLSEGTGRARSKTDADKTGTARDECDGTNINDEAGDDCPPKRKGRARMSQEKRRRLARRKEREALMLLGLPPIPSSAPAHNPTFRLPPLITNTLASVASSNLSPEERAAAVEAARVLVASSGLFNLPSRNPARSATRTSSVDLLDRRQGSLPNLRSARTAFGSQSTLSYFPSSLDSPDTPFSRLSDGPSEHGHRQLTAGSIHSQGSYTGSLYGMPSLSHGGSVGSSPASTPLQTPDNFMAPLPATLLPADAHSIGPDPRKTMPPLMGSSDALVLPNPAAVYGSSKAMPSLAVPNVRVMPPTPHSKGLLSSVSVPKMTTGHEGRVSGGGGEEQRGPPRFDGRLGLLDDDLFPPLSSSVSRSSGLSSSVKTGYGPIGTPKKMGSGAYANLPSIAVPASSQQHLNRPRSHTSLSISPSAPSFAMTPGLETAFMSGFSFGGSGGAATSSAATGSAADDAIARVEASWRAHQIRHDQQLAPTSGQRPHSQSVLYPPSAAERPMTMGLPSLSLPLPFSAGGSAAASSALAPSSSPSSPTTTTTSSSTSSSSPSSCTAPGPSMMMMASAPFYKPQQQQQQQQQQRYSMSNGSGPSSYPGAPRTSSPPHIDLSSGGFATSALGIELNMGGPLDFGGPRRAEPVADV
ncbi:hypothetical protein OC835_000389 [Tilletia horrida]|nr:hypothetical protein OC835_000389 [Tilletia horrida]